VGPSGHFGWSDIWNGFKIFFSAFVAAVTFVVVTFLTGSPLLGAAAAGFMGGLTYGLISGSGIKASLQMGGWGALMAVGTFTAAALGGPQVAMLMKYASLGLSVARDGWKGIVNFGSGLAGAHLGQKVGNSVVGKIQTAGNNSNRELKAYPEAGNKPHFEYGGRSGQLADASDVMGGDTLSDALPDYGGMGMQASDSALSNLQPGQSIGSALTVRVPVLAGGLTLIESGSLVLRTGVLLLPEFPAGTIAGVLLVGTGGAMVGIGYRISTEALGITNRYWPK